MALFFSLLPLYIFGNLHCFGMCGPLVMLLAKQRFRYLYFFGRLFSFTLAATLAAEAGVVLQLFLKTYHLMAFLTLFFGGAISLFGLCHLFNWSLPFKGILARRFGRIDEKLSTLLLQDRAFATFLFGFFTVMLPCGQSLIVFSACAVSGSAVTGFFNGLAFALLTSPALFFAMKARHFLSKTRPFANQLMGAAALIVGILALLRGFAEMEWISHFILNSQASHEYHLVLF